MKILFIDEDKSLQLALKRAFVERGHDFYSAQDFKTALELAKKEKPQVILLDLLLPGEDGFEVLRNFKNEPDIKNIPIIILTNLSGEEDRSRAFNLGAADFMIKANYSLSEVVNRVESIVN